MPSSSLDARIDEIYKATLDEFVAERQALSKALTGEERKLVAGLQKPLTLPWLVNQTYWRARRAYDELLEAGKKLRETQVAALKGRGTDIRGASERHNKALTQAVAEAVRIAGEAGVAAPEDGLRRMFEAVSTRESLPAPHGRFVRPLEPAGFEALAGIAIAPRSTAAIPAARRPSGQQPDEKTPAAAATRAQKKGREADERRRDEERRRAQEEVESRRRRAAAVRAAEKRLNAALDAERRARETWEKARQKREALDRELAELLEQE